MYVFKVHTDKRAHGWVSVRDMIAESTTILEYQGLIELLNGPGVC